MTHFFGGPDHQSERWHQLLLRIGQRDETALSALYDSTSRMIYALALRILNDHTAAEDVTLDVYMHAWNKSSDYDARRGTPLTWLFIIARSKAIDRRRSLPKDQTGKEPLELVEDTHSPTGDPELSAEMSEKRESVRRALQTLRPEERAAIELAYFSGLSQSEIATRLREPLGTVKTRIRRGMVQLRELLLPYEVQHDRTARISY